MEQQESEEEYAPIFEALRKQKGNCPDGDVLLTYVQGELEMPQADALKKHLSACGLCQELSERLALEQPALDEVAWKRIEKKLDDRPAPWKKGPARKDSFPLGWRSYVAAAALVGVIGASVWLSSERGRVTGPVSETRGNAVQLQDPAGRIDKLEDFRWSALPIAGNFRIQVQEGDKLIWEAVTAESRYVPPEELRRLLRPDTRFRWRIQALGPAREVVGESTWIEFTLSP
jgi:hypothetical protein